MRTKGPGFLFLVFSLSLTFTANIQAQEEILRPNDLACPLTADLFPERIQSADSIKFIFSKNAFPQRISIALNHPENKDIYVKYEWVGVKGWGKSSGFFVVKGDGKPNCFFLIDANIPSGVQSEEFILRIPEGLRVLEVAFSSLSSEKPMVLCPMPELEGEISRAYLECERDPTNENKASILIQVLEKVTPCYDCRRTYDAKPVPAWWMASDYSTQSWIEYLHKKTLEGNSEALRVYVKFFEGSDGYWATEIRDALQEILEVHPNVVLQNWTGIKENRWWILECIVGNKKIAKLIAIYEEIAKKEPAYRAACNAIISIFYDKNQTEYQVLLFLFDLPPSYDSSPCGNRTPCELAP